MYQTLTYIYKHALGSIKDYREIWFEVAFVQIITRIAQFIFVWAFFNIGLPYGFSSSENQALLSNFDILNAIDIQRLVVVGIICGLGAVIFYSLEVLSIVVISDAYYEGREVEMWKTFKEIITKTPLFFYSVGLQVAIYSFITSLYASAVFIAFHFLPIWLAIIAILFPTYKYLERILQEFLRLTYVNYRIFDEPKTAFGLFDYILNKTQLREIWVFSFIVISISTLVALLFNSVISLLLSGVIWIIPSLKVVSLFVSSIVFISLVISIIANACATAYVIIYRSKVYHEVFEKPHVTYVPAVSALKTFIYRTRLYSVIAVLLVCLISISIQSRLFQDQVTTYLELDFITMAHRGGDGLDNTEESIRDSIEQGFDAVEIDVQITKDKKLVLFHDEFIDLNGSDVAVSDALWEDISSFRFANQRPLILLEDAISLAGEDIGLNIELKLYNADLRQDIYDQLIPLYETIPDDAFKLVTSLDDELIELVEQENPDIDTGLIITASLGKLDEVNTDWLLINNIFYQANSSAFATTDKKLALWSFSQDWVGDYAFANGLDAAITDQPEELKEFEESFDRLPREQKLLQSYFWSVEYTDLGLGIERF